MTNPPSSTPVDGFFLEWYEAVWEQQLESEIFFYYGKKISQSGSPLPPVYPVSSMQFLRTAGVLEVENIKIFEIPADLLTTEQLIEAKERFTGTAIADKMTKGQDISKTRRWRIKRLTAEIEARQKKDKK